MACVFYINYTLKLKSNRKTGYWQTNIYKIGEMGICREIFGLVFKVDSSRNKLLIEAGCADVNSGLIVQKEKDDNIE